MKKLLFIYIFCYIFPVFATSYVEPIYYLNGKEDSCIYGMSELCKSCDSPESFRIVKAVLIDENGKHVEVDETVCPQRKLICDEDGSYCYSVLKECPKNFPIRSGYHCRSCNYNLNGPQGGTVIVDSEKDCMTCSNRKLIKENGKIYCVIKPEFAQKPLHLKHGYAGCNDCVNEKEIEDCSKCLKYYDIIDGKCKKKNGWKCHQPYYVYP